MSRSLTILVVAVALTFANQSGYADIIYDAAADFSPTSNPTGVWTYGYSNTLGGQFILYTEHGDYTNPNGDPTGLDYWGHSIQFHVPSVIHNGTAVPLELDNSALFAPGQLGFHPGPEDEISIVRFTAPTSGAYLLNSLFTGIDFYGPTTTDVHVLLNETSIFDDLVNGFGTGPDFSKTLNLVAGDHVDFAVGYGTNGNFDFDSTGLAATLTTLSSVPEPASIMLLGSGLTAMLGIAHRRKVTS